MESLYLIFWTGLAAGIVHVYIGADHLAALMPISVGRKSAAAWLGVRWGVAHSIGVLIIAAILLATKSTMDPTFLSAWSERLIGIMLIAFGILGIRAAYRNKFHLHQHTHDGKEHSHLHLHKGEESHTAKVNVAQVHIHKHAALGAGTLQGVAGMAHVMGVLPSLAFSSLMESVVYLAAFAIGSIAGMAIFAAVFGTITAKLGERAPRLISGSMYFAAIACMLVGVTWIAMPFFGMGLP